MLKLYTDESPGLKVDPVVVLVLSLGFIFSVVGLHGMCFSTVLAPSACLGSLGLFPIRVFVDVGILLIFLDIIYVFCCAKGCIVSRLVTFN